MSLAAQSLGPPALPAAGHGALHPLVDRAGRDRDPVRVQRRRARARPGRASRCAGSPATRRLSVLARPGAAGRAQAHAPPGGALRASSRRRSASRSRSACSAGAAAASGTVNMLMLLPLVTPEIVMGVALLLLFLQVFTGSASARRRRRSARSRSRSPTWSSSCAAGWCRSGRSTRRPPPTSALRRTRALPRAAAAARAGDPRQRGGRLRALDRRLRRHAVPRRATRARRPCRCCSTPSARGAPTPALNALATIALFITLLTLALVFLVYRRFAGGERRRRGRRPGGVADAGRDPCSKSARRSRSATSSPWTASTWTCRRGEFFTMVGPSGCGKTTTLRMIAGFERPTSGRDPARRRRRRADAAAPAQRQHGVPELRAVPAPRTSRDNVAFGLQVPAGRRRTSAQARWPRRSSSCSSTSFAKRKPAQLSGGQQQRVALARALVCARACCCSTSRSARSTRGCARTSRSS